MELAAIVCLVVDLGVEDEGDSYEENHVVSKVHRALDREVTESPYLAR